MRPEDLAAFAVGAAVPLWKPAVSESNMPIHVGDVYNLLVDCKVSIEKLTAQQERFSDLPTKQQKDFEANLLEFLEKNHFIAKGARTGADWPAAALAGLFAGSALQAVRERAERAKLVAAEEYHKELQKTYYSLWSYGPEKADELRLAAVRLVVFSFVWYEYPRDLDRCRERLDALAPAVALSCLELLRPPDEWTSLQGQSKFFFVDKKK